MKKMMFTMEGNLCAARIREGRYRHNPPLTQEDYWMKRADNIEQAKNEVEENTIESEEMDKAYDGYYDDIVPDDFGNYQFQKSNGNLMKRIVLVIAGALAVIIISAVVMYYL